MRIENKYVSGNTVKRITLKGEPVMTSTQLREMLNDGAVSSYLYSKKIDGVKIEWQDISYFAAENTHVPYLKSRYMLNVYDESDIIKFFSAKKLLDTYKEFLDVYFSSTEDLEVEFPVVRKCTVMGQSHLQRSTCYVPFYSKTAQGTEDTTSRKTSIRKAWETVNGIQDADLKERLKNAILDFLIDQYNRRWE